MEKIIRLLNSKYFWIPFAGLTVFVYFFGLTVPLLGPDEPRYAQVAREMYERGDWVTPTLGGFDWFEKPALLYWLQIVSYGLFGVSEFAARLGSALFGLGTIASLWLIGRRFGLEERLPVEVGHDVGLAGQTDLANWFGLIAASTLGLIVFARGASFDIILTFPITAAMAAFYVFDSISSGRGAAGVGRTYSPYWALALFYFFMGVSLLAKGLVGAVFPFAIIAFYYLLSWRLPSRAFILSLIWGGAIAIAVAAAWYFPMYQRNGWKFIDEFFIQHHFQRYTSNKYLHPQPFHFFFWVLPLMTLPWLPFFFAAVWRIVKGFGSSLGSLPNGSARSFRFLSFSTPLLRFSIAWMLVPLVFFSFSGSKLPGYILPSVPPAILLVTLYVLGFIERKPGRPPMVKLLASGMLLAAIVIAAFALPRFADLDSVKGLITAANERGYASEKILTLHAVSHNAEFYAAGRLLRDDKGVQRRLLGPAEVLAEVRRSDTGGELVIVPLEYLPQLTNSDMLSSEVIRDNGEFAIAHVRAK